MDSPLSLQKTASRFLNSKAMDFVLWQSIVTSKNHSVLASNCQPTRFRRYTYYQYTPKSSYLTELYQIRCDYPRGLRRYSTLEPVTPRLECVPCLFLAASSDLQQRPAAPRKVPPRV